MKVEVKPMTSYSPHTGLAAHAAIQSGSVRRRISVRSSSPFPVSSSQMDFTSGYSPKYWSSVVTSPNAA